MEKFRDRLDAGKQLATALQAYQQQPDVIVLALPRGGVPIAYEIATALAVPLDIFVVRKLGTPGQEELAMGAIASGNVAVFNDDIIRETGVSKTDIDNALVREKAELLRRESAYRGNHLPLKVTGKTLILVDDGIATGATLRAAITALRLFAPASIIVAVPVASQDTCHAIDKLADKVICLLRPIDLQAVGLWYDSFDQTSDDEVRQCLHDARLRLK